MRYPGFGPWSHLPPWERPGWKFGRGRGWCWWYYAPSVASSREEEIKLLEEEASYLEERLKDVQKRLKELRKE